uniref:BHLH domain-containing protein n=1 Tax=Stomoxys calcitrans TaxID=35570 RepID=A0A1I8PL62_STOCA
MFTIMDSQNRKRARMVNSPASHNDCLQGIAASTGSGSTTLAIGGQSFILSNAGTSSSLPANILLSICDDNSDESEEYIIDSSVLQQIKQESNVATQTTPSSNTTQQQQQPASAQLLTTVPQYRIINQSSGKSLLNHNNNTSFTSTTAPTTTLVSSIPAMQLSSGCEIYVIKEVVEQQPPKQLLADTAIPGKLLGNTGNTIKLEPISPASAATAAGSLQILRTSSSATSSNTHAQTQPQQQSIASNLCQNSIVVNTTDLSPQPEQDSTKRSLILEAYKKRDDKRRATHNEVERRRRDKINSWIFKLKEMLPSDMNNVVGTTHTKDGLNNTNATSTLSPTSRLLIQQGSTTPTTTRTPPSDSKSQILIKACEYIKSMQEEIQSLRECLTENENLRLSNQLLQDELNNLRNKQQTRQHKNLNNNNNNINSNNNNNRSSNNALLLNTQSDDDECELTLNSLNTTYANVQLFSPNSNLAAMIGPTTINTTTTTSASATSNSGIIYAKRELIIRDYVD